MLRRPLPRRRLVWTVAVLTLLWGGLTGWDPEGWFMGVPAVLAGAALAMMLPWPAYWRLSPLGALRFAGWFAVQSVRGAVDVSRRALSPDMRLRPGFRHYPLQLSPGAARTVFINTITLMPGTLSAQIDPADGDHPDDRLLVHMLDTEADLTGALQVHEARIRAAFALPPQGEER
ncbi:Na+/H+ antiporter subunit E [Rhodobacteraceae bacterium 2376]|uniref:Na+/H+ antiporter subunit E n=1 Tax=Rhabdonatronobacter sediminivivens TaxID=2743469 RepID=A0A7Z0I101_9RHOB|nr:Na+/H+ antiporter subunit E [Rhabdonatronobacter sediminivivens]NYS25652.1 Na+/H+ antiporter subunit E [Rhabdonatronobacter sediminivivens]